jgi:hypothetical protein
MVPLLVPFDENDPGAKTFVSAFTQALADLGWTDSPEDRGKYGIGFENNELLLLLLVSILLVGHQHHTLHQYGPL